MRHLPQIWPMFALLWALLPGCFFGSECRQDEDCNGGVAICTQGSCSPNQPPTVPKISASSTTVALEKSTELRATSMDPEGRELQYQWSDDGCKGSFSAPKAAATTWRPPRSYPGDAGCELRLEVTDANRGKSSATITLTVLPPNRPPRLLESAPKETQIRPGQRLQLQVKAEDPEGQALTFTWSTERGHLGAPQHQKHQSAVTWTASTLPHQCDAAVQVQIKDPEGLSIRHTFQLQCQTWVVPFLARRGSQVPRLVVDAKGNAYAIGVFKGGLEMGTLKLEQRGDQDGFLAKLDARGKPLWLKHFGHEDGNFSAQAIAIDGESLYVLGYFTGKTTAIEDQVIHSSSRDPVPSNPDALLLKYSTSGERIWLRHIGGKEGIFTSALALGKDGSVHVAGHYSRGGIPTFKDKGGAITDLPSPPPGGSCFILKISPQGALLWFKGYGSAGVKLDPLDLVVGAQAEIYLTGYIQSYGSETRFTFGGKTHALHGQHDLFLARLDGQGKAQWSRHAGGKGPEFGIALALHPEGGVYVVGNARSDLRLEDDSGSFERKLQGHSDGFIASLDAQGKYRWAKTFGGPNPPESLERFDAVVVHQKRLFVSGALASLDSCGTPFAAKGNVDMVLLELATKDGSCLSLQHQGGKGIDHIAALHIGPQGDMYVAGLLSKTLDLFGYTLENPHDKTGFLARIPLP